jgi:phosphohistidine phosphatase
MMEIYLLRHGIAEDAKPGEPDSGRALTNEGREKLRRVLRRVRAADVSPTLILSSPYRRAVETADIAAQVLGYKGKVVQIRALTPDGSPGEVWEEIRSRKDEDAILLAGHEPLMGAIAAYLLDCPGLQVDVKKGSVIRADCDRFAPQPKCVLKWMITPALCVEL